MKIPFHKPIMPESLSLVFPDSVMDGWLTTGPQVKIFEDALKRYLNVEFVVAVNSCTAALHLALAAKGYGKGDKFIVPTYTFVSSVEVGEYLGMEPVLIDCDESFNLDLNQCEHILKKDKKVKCIIPVHIAGKPADMISIQSLANDNNLFILEDAAHALETRSNIGKVGDTDHAASFSFYANKNITTFGEGGAIASNDQNLANKIRKLSLHGMSKDGWKRFKTGSKWEYDVSELGYKYNLTDLAAAFGTWQLNNIKIWHDRRKYIFDKYQNSFKNISGIVCPIPANDNEIHAYHLYIIKIVPSKWSIDRNEVIKLLSEKGIGTSVHYKPVHLHSYYHKKYGYRPGDFPTASLLFNNIITLPLYPSLNDIQVNYIIESFISLWNKYKS